MEAGVSESSMTLPRVDTAAPQRWCRHAIDCPKVARLAARYSASNSGSFIQRRRVLYPTAQARAALLEAPMREQGGNGFLLLAAEFRSVAGHLGSPGIIWPPQFFAARFISFIPGRGGRDARSQGDLDELLIMCHGVEAD